MVVFQFKTLRKQDWRNAPGNSRFRHRCHPCRAAHHIRPRPKAGYPYLVLMAANHELSAQLQADPLAGPRLQRGCKFLLTQPPQTFEWERSKQNTTEKSSPRWTLSITMLRMATEQTFSCSILWLMTRLAIHTISVYESHAICYHVPMNTHECVLLPRAMWRSGEAATCVLQCFDHCVLQRLPRS